MGTPIPNAANEMKGIGTSPVKSYMMSPEELEDYKTRTGKSQPMIREKSIDLSRMAGSPNKSGRPAAKENPASGLTKRKLLEGIAAGLTLTAIEKKWGMKYNTIHQWVKKWELKGTTPGKARELLGLEGVVSIVKEEIAGPEEIRSEPDAVSPASITVGERPESPELRELSERAVETPAPETKKEINPARPIRVIQISIPLIDVGTDHTEQWLKSVEELKEYAEEMHVPEIDFRKAVSELFDLNQTFAGLLRAQLERFIDNDIESHILKFFDKANQSHLEKIQGYAGERNWKMITV